MKKRNMLKSTISSSLIAFLLACSCSKSNTANPPTTVPPVIVPGSNDVDFWLTIANQTKLLEKQSGVLSFGTTTNSNANIDVDSAQSFQTIDGFGYTLTGASAFLINQLPAATKASLLQELFGNNSTSIGVSYLRVSIGASDLSTSVFSYNDLSAGQTDVNLNNFSLSLDTTDLIPVLKEIIAINPNIKIMGSPWSPPVWMKSNGSSIGGTLLPQYFNVYANYFVKYIQAMKAKGITIDAVTLQNEPENPNNNPSLLMPSSDAINFVKNNLGPAFQAAAINTKIIVWDHNCDNPNYPISVLNDAAARSFINGSAFHLYAGDISAMSSVHGAYPDKDLYFTEQWTSSTGNFDGDFKWHIRNVIIGSMRNWSKVALEWNLANNIFYGPHTPGGCSQCKGALTLGSSSVNRNVAYYIVAQIAKFVPPGSVRIASNISGNLLNVAFKTPAGKKVLLVLNEGAAAATFNIRYKNKWVAATLPANSAGTFVW